MSFNWHDFIKLGELLLSTEKEVLEEAHLRTSTSRLYYGVFGLIMDKLRSKELKVPRNRSVHTHVIQILKKSTDEKECQTGLLLDRLRRERNIADYDSEISINEIRVRNSREYARLILESL